MKNLKWQIHSETAMTQIMLWIILWKLFGGWVGYLAILFIVGNIITLVKSTLRMDKNYFK